MPLPAIPFILLGLTAAGFAAVTQKPKKKRKPKAADAYKTPGTLPSGYDPNKPKVIFGLHPDTPKFGLDELDPNVWRKGDIATFMVGQLDFPDNVTENLGRLYRPDAADLGHKGMVDYRLTDIEMHETGMKDFPIMQAVWRFARIGQNKFAPYSWTFYKFHSYFVPESEINYFKGGSPSVAALKVVRDGNVIWSTRDASNDKVS